MERTLSIHIWKLKDEGMGYDISWSVIEKAPDVNLQLGNAHSAL